jgi:hypothetical protein
MRQFNVGQIVRIFYDDDCFDEGFIREINDHIEVDFYDWITIWPLTAEFSVQSLHHERISYLVPLEVGTVVATFTHSGHYQADDHSA